MNKIFHINTDNLNTSLLIAGHQKVQNLKQICLSLLLLLTLGNGHAEQSTTKPASTQQASIKSEKPHTWITIGEHGFAVALADTDAAREFTAMLPLTLDMTDLNNNEKEADLPKALTTDTYRPGTINNGDIMLWGSRTLVVFYKTFNTSYSYTRIGHIEDNTNLSAILGTSETRITFSKN
ncbi:cyclophilin-like fold protein [Marinomonas sp. IMCC 4694]|uniref:cyclophilin-like fold protein n=1 Tax=Marinomonas sp. IMCC 4694 TaxID=2605432 RepID=UPI001652E3D1|nr:cyclophilin-like fold protein [Marinomonas sp. IMCC 4694]